MYYDFIQITKMYIYNRKYPTLLIEGVLHTPEDTFRVCIDGKQAPFYQLQVTGNTFCLAVELEHKEKQVQVYLKHEGQEHILCELENNSLKRIKTDLKRWLEKWTYDKKRAKRTRGIVYAQLSKEIAYLWKIHHLLVPLSLWKVYKRRFMQELSYALYGIQTFDIQNSDEYTEYLTRKKWGRGNVAKTNTSLAILLTTTNPSIEQIKECLCTIVNQSYSTYTIYLINSEAIDSKQLEEILKNKNIEIVTIRGDVVLSEVLPSITEEYLVFIDDTMLLMKDTLMNILNVIQKNRHIDVIYADEDAINKQGKRCFPIYKPDFSPDTLLSHNYIGDFMVVKKELLETVSKQDIYYLQSDNYALLLDILAQTKNILHIDKILYHRRLEAIHKPNADKYRQIVERFLSKQGKQVSVESEANTGGTLVKYEYEKEPSISIIIPMRDQAQVTQTCLESIFNKTTYTNYEVIIVNNSSVEPETFSMLDSFQKKYANFSVMEANIPFNFSLLNNMAVTKSTSEYVVLLNNDTEVITPTWLEWMVGYAKQSHVGTVGAKLLYPDDTIQHGGVVIGVSGIANHAFLGEPRKSLGLYGRLVLPYNYAANTAACIMIAKDKYQVVGGLENNLTVAYNDIDFNLKLLEHGYYNVFLPTVELYHYESKSRGAEVVTEKDIRFLKEQSYMLKRWHNYIDRDPFYNTNFSKAKSFTLTLPRKKDYEDTENT